MNILNCLRICVLCCSLIPVLAIAASKEELAPDIWTVVSGGSWREGVKDGYYRVIVRLGGWENVYSRVSLQWIDRPTSPNESSKVVHTEPLKRVEGEYIRITSIPEFFTKGDNVFLRFKAAHAYAYDEKTKAEELFVIAFHKNFKFSVTRQPALGKVEK